MAHFLFTHWLVLFLLALLLTGCVTLRDPEASYEYNGDIVATIDASHSVGQSFISRRPGLVNVQLYLRKASAQALDSDILNASLYHTPQDTQPLVDRSDHLQPDHPLFPGNHRLSGSE